MRVLDFTHRIEPDMPVYPGTEPPRLSPANTYEKDGFRETLLSLYSHTGTHMDAPAHLFAHQPTLDALPAAQFVGPALVVDCSDAAAGAVLTMERLAPVRQLADRAAFFADPDRLGPLLGHAGLLWGLSGHRAGRGGVSDRLGQAGHRPGYHRRGCHLQ